MKCKCGKECGIRIWCLDCEHKALRELDIIKSQLAYKTARFVKKMKKLYYHIHPISNKEKEKGFLMKIERISEVTDGKKQEHVHHIEVLWDGGDWKRVKCTDPECDYELEIYYGEE